MLEDHSSKWSAAASPGGLIGLTLTILSFIVVVTSILSIAGRFDIALGEPVLYAILAVSTFTTFILLYLLFGYITIRYEMKPSQLDISWGIWSITIPYSEIEAVEPASDVAAYQPTGWQPYWPGYHIGSRSTDIGNVRVVATLPPRRQVLIGRTDGEIYAISPERPMLFMEEFARWHRRYRESGETYVETRPVAAYAIHEDSPLDSQPQSAGAAHAIGPVDAHYFEEDAPESRDSRPEYAEQSSYGADPGIASTQPNTDDVQEERAAEPRFGASWPAESPPEPASARHEPQDRIVDPGTDDLASPDPDDDYDTGRIPQFGTSSATGEQAAPPAYYGYMPPPGDDQEIETAFQEESVTEPTSPVDEPDGRDSEAPVPLGSQPAEDEPEPADVSRPLEPEPEPTQVEQRFGTFAPEVSASFVPQDDPQIPHDPVETPDPDDPVPYEVWFPEPPSGGDEVELQEYYRQYIDPDQIPADTSADSPDAVPPNAPLRAPAPVISPAGPPRSQVMQPLTRVHRSAAQETSPAIRPAIHRDPVALTFIGAGALATAAMALYILVQYQDLPPSLTFHWNVDGLPGRVGEPQEVWTLPVLAALVLIANTGLAWSIAQFDRFAARLMLSSTLLVHIVTWVALLMILP